MNPHRINLVLAVAELEEGFCRATVTYARKYDGVFESFHGGLLMTVADSDACFAVMAHTGRMSR